MIHGKSNLDVLVSLDKTVFGHNEAKKALISLVNRSKIRHHMKYMELANVDHLAPHKVLLLGESGTGKTHLVESLKRIVEFPLIRIDATKLNPTGASGGITSKNLAAMIVDKAKEVTAEKYSIYHSVEGAIDQTVVFVDEIDKLGHSFDSSGKWNQHVQSNFLTMFDNKEEFSGVSFIFAGAFTHISDKAADTRTGLGFNPEAKKAAIDTLDKDIIDGGLIPELIGRMNRIVQLDKFKHEDYTRILDMILLPNKLKEYEYYGLDEIVLTKEQLDQMIVTAMASKQGIRALHRELNKYFADFEFNYEDMRYLDTDL